MRIDEQDIERIVGELAERGRNPEILAGNPVMSE